MAIRRRPPVRPREHSRAKEKTLSTWVNWDPWFLRAANISQALLLVLAVFGYFYSVRPAFQKELLGEEIAAKELELLKMGREQVKLKQNQAALELNVLAASNDLKRIQIQIYHAAFSESLQRRLAEGRLDGPGFAASPTMDRLSQSMPGLYLAVSEALASGAADFSHGTQSISNEVRALYLDVLKKQLEENRASFSPSSANSSLLSELNAELRQATADKSSDPDYSQLERALASAYHIEEIRAASFMHDVRDEVIAESNRKQP